MNLIMTMLIEIYKANYLKHVYDVLKLSIKCLMPNNECAFYSNT